MFDLVTVPNSI